MPLRIQWDDNGKTRVLCSIEGDFSLPDGMFNALREVDVLANEVERQIGVIMDWTYFQPFIPDNPKFESQPEDVHGRRSILRGDFGSSRPSIGINLTALEMKDNPKPNKIAVMVFVLPDSISNATKITLTQMLGVAKNQTHFAISASLEEARKMVEDHFK